jgi:hypothetical protein
MAINTWRIMATPQVCRRSDIASPSIQQAGRRPDIKAAGFFNTTGRGIGLDIAQQLAVIFPEVRPQYSSCGRKVSYPSLEEALKVKDRREAQAGVALRLYRCYYSTDTDEHWHLSHRAPSPDHMARLSAEVEAIAQDMVGKIETYQKQLDDLYPAIARVLKRLRDRRPWPKTGGFPSIATMTRIYEDQRDDLIILSELRSRRTDLECELNQLLIAREICFSPHKHPTLEEWQGLVTRLEDEVVYRDDQHEHNQATINAALAHYESKHRRNVERVRAEMNELYKLPSFARATR